MTLSSGFGGTAEALRRLLLLVEPEDGSQSPLLDASDELVDAVIAAGEAARAARELFGLVSEGQPGYDATSEVETHRTTLLPLNRKERFYTGTVLPLLLASDGFAHLHRFLALCGLTDVVTPPRRDGTAPCQLITEYNFAESLYGADDQRWEARLRPGDTPDLVLVAPDWLVAVEAKMFDRPTAAALVAQLDRQQPFLAEWASVIEVPLDRVRHVALLPEQLAAEIGGSPDRLVVTWQDVLRSYRLVGPPYWVGTLDVALSRWPQQVAPPRIFGRNAEVHLTGDEIVDLCAAGMLTSGYMGRVNGLDPSGPLMADVASGNWRGHRYEVRADELPGNPNWFPIEAFISLVAPESA